LDGGAAAEVVAALDRRGVPHEVRGDAIYAPAAERDALRIALAGEGLPATGAAGYELLDDLSGFGTTSQMFDAAYWRAKEGELARTITASPQIRAARVHIANPSSQPFRRDSAPTASIFVTPAGAGFSPEQAQALKFLVAAAVSRLEPAAVSVIDSASGTVIEGQEEAPPAVAEAERAAELERSVERLLEARVGAGRAIVEVRIEPQTDRESIVERRLDPEGRVAISTETEERTSTSQGPAGGAVTVASDLPDGDAGGEAGDRSSRDSETRERTNFEISETQREILREPGGIRRLTVAVLVDGTRETGPDGSETWSPRSEEELADMRELVASAVGYDDARGDRITIKSLAFEALPEAANGTAPPDGLGLDPMRLAQIGTLAAVALVLGLFVLRPILAGRPAAASLPAPEAEAGASRAASGAALTGEIEDGAYGGPARVGVAEYGAGFETDGPALPALSDGTADPVSRLRALIDERQDETMEILRGWMTDEKERV
ncbi:MAG: flagellar M-ring protein FliF, partial [Alphaproteobacteria bacterium]|nr:flagellar M-ring protein FliF [Alphaproteobacteria bacterium]